MTESLPNTMQHYLSAAEALLERVEACCDRFNEDARIDIDNQRTGNMLTLTLHIAGQPSSQVVINLQKPLQEVWLAAKSGGYHYQLKQGLWIDSKHGGEFWQDLSAAVSAQMGLPLPFTPAET